MRKNSNASSRDSEKKSNAQENFSMMARVWEKGIRGKKFVLPVIHPLFFFFLRVFCNVQENFISKT